MACNNICKLCSRLVISQSISFTGGNLVVNLPAGSYNNCGKYCIVLAQSIPTTTTISAPVVFTIGDGTEQYALVNKCCKPVTACGVRTRTRYSTVVETTSTTAIFKMLGKPCCQPNNDLQSVNGTAPTV
nr:MAG TPA: hypothetical protein [Caudoviricetes sp.]